MFDDRLIIAKTPIAASEPELNLRFARLNGREKISECFSYTVELLSEDLEIAAKDLLGQSVTIEARGRPEDDRPPRFFNGLVDSFSFTGMRERSGIYHLVLRPTFWNMSKTTDNRIFQEKSVPEILELLFVEHACQNFEFHLDRTYERRVYCVQYGETTLNFVMRLMEHEGIWFYFTHEDGAHTMVVTDHVTQMGPAPGFEVLPFEPNATQNLWDDDAITNLMLLNTAVTGSFAHTDYDFEKPSADLMAVNSMPQSREWGDRSAGYEYPGTYTDLGRGSSLARIRNEQDQALAHQVFATSTVRGPCAGQTFMLEGYPREAENIEYFVYAADYDLSDGQYVAHPDGDASEGFSAEYTLVPVTVPFRPERVTRRARIEGPQTAVVVGPAGEEIHTDKYSRVKVQFFWDRDGQRDENTSCWVRVSSVWAGAGWGFIQIPRIGQEVIVDFLEGDPDQPIITGRVYNAEQMPPYGLPGEATKSGWKSNSSLGGGGWNELMFEDKKGEELVYFQAEKDHDELVKNNETRHIGNDWEEDVVRNARQWNGGWRKEVVDLDKSTTIHQNRDVRIDLNDTESVGVDRSLTVGANETINVGANSSETIGINHTQTVGAAQVLAVGAARTRTVAAAEAVTVGAAQAIAVAAARTVTVGGAQSHTVADTHTLDVGASQSTTIGSDQAVSVGGGQTVTVQNDQVTNAGGNIGMEAGSDIAQNAGSSVAVSAGDSIVLSVGSASLSMKSDGTIVLKGSDITIEGSGKIVGKAGGTMTLKGSKILQN